MIRDFGRQSVSGDKKVMDAFLFKRITGLDYVKLPASFARGVVLITLFVACYAMLIGLAGCDKEEKEAISEEVHVSAVAKKSETASSAEVIAAEAYKDVLVVSEIDGVDWQRGVITAVGRGLPPKDITNPAQVRILTMRAAKIEGYKKLIEVIMKMKTPPDKGMSEYLEEKHIDITRIEGFVKGAMVVREEYLDDGSAEVTLEVFLTGANGLVAVLK